MINEEIDIHGNVIEVEVGTACGVEVVSRGFTSNGRPLKGQQTKIFVSLFVSNVGRRGLWKSRFSYDRRED